MEDTVSVLSRAFLTAASELGTKSVQLWIAHSLKRGGEILGVVLVAQCIAREARDPCPLRKLRSAREEVDDLLCHAPRARHVAEELPDLWRKVLEAMLGARHRATM